MSLVIPELDEQPRVSLEEGWKDDSDPGSPAHHDVESSRPQLFPRITMQ